jgi:hypothetical protein
LIRVRWDAASLHALRVYTRRHETVLRATQQDRVVVKLQEKSKSYHLKALQSIADKQVGDENCTFLEDTVALSSRSFRKLGTSPWMLAPPRKGGSVTNVPRELYMIGNSVSSLRKRDR